MEFTCKNSARPIIPNPYNRDATSQKDCVFSYCDKKQDICELCMQYVNSPKTK